MSSDNNYGDDRNKQEQNQNRQFGCPCGKTYLSYPALYTHVRTKHDGKPPGDLMKPKNQKTRGRPRLIIVQTPIDDSQCPFDIKQQIEKVLIDLKTDYNGKFENSSGHSTCQDMATKFIKDLQGIGENQIKIVKCLMNCLKQFINSKYGANYWSQNSPKQIIDIVNQFYHSCQSKKQTYPLEKKTIIQVVFLLFKWMYRNRWTEHKLAKRVLAN